MKTHLATLAEASAEAWFFLVAALAAMPFQPRASAQEVNGEKASGVKARATVGAYYFDGWAGSNPLADDPSQPWAKTAPTHLTRRMVEEFPEREPLWGWRDDSLEIMERQIDLAADHGLAFFAFCWYWHDDAKAINPQAIKDDPKHTGLELYLQARNHSRLKFCFLVANHKGFEIKGTEHWKQAADFWMPYLQHPQCLRVGGKPLVIIFNQSGGDPEGFAYLQEKARSAGLPGVAIAVCGNGAAATGYTHRTHYNIVPGYAAGSQERKYAELVQAHQQAWQGSPAQPYIPEVTAGWDKRPWEKTSGLNQESGWYFPDRTPEQFADFLRDAIAWMDAHPDQTTAERVVLIYAWNELGEGGYIAPTKGDPQGRYLGAIQSVVAGPNPETPSPPTAADDADKTRR